MDALLQLNNVESAYGPVRAIRGVSLSVLRGQIAAVLGSNGAGKLPLSWVRMVRAKPPF